MRPNKSAVRPRAILFDLDGVLWFSVDAHRAAFEKAFHEMGLPLTFSKRAFSPYSGMTTEKALHHVLQDHKIRWTAGRRAEFSRRKRAWALRYLQKEAKLQQRLLPTLKRLRRTHLLGLVSSGHPQTIRVFLKRSRSERLFSVILSHGDVPYSKPHPRIYKTALRRLRLRPHEAVAIEDTVSGTHSARGAGIPVIGMRGTCAPKLLRRAGAFKIVSRLTDLLNHASDL
jgi:beta-phosphoglucomutase